MYFLLCAATILILVTVLLALLLLKEVEPVVQISNSFFRYRSRVGGTPVVSRETWTQELPFLLDFEKAYSQISNEVNNCIDADEPSPIRYDAYFTDIADDKWSRIKVKWYGVYNYRAKWMLPSLFSLSQHPEVLSVMVSILEPGCRISRHKSPYAGVLRAHLGLECPHGCELELDGDTIAWQERKCIVWDDTYPHSVHNASNKRRVVVYIDVRRPLRGTNILQQMLETIAYCYFAH